ncbi:MAG: CaiB/BaiF CoA-transferase family protein [Sneathiella sp.]
MTTQKKDGWQPLHGLRVIDFSMLLPGPLTTLVLADLGAEVIKVEPPGGDYSRHMKGHIFEGTNRNKRSIVIDMKSPSSASIIEQLALYGDIVIEGFRPGVAKRLGFDAQSLQAVNPDLIYCSLSGFGQTGPASKKAGHDLAYIAMGGGLVHKGQLRQQPSRAALPIADLAGGSFAAIAILAALHGKKPGERGAVLDLSLYESMMYTSAIRFGFHTSPDAVEHLYPANDLFTCADGRQIALTIVEEKFWVNFVEMTKDYQPAFGETVFQTEEGRLVNFERLMALLDQLLATRPAEEWVSIMDKADVPAAVCVPLSDAIQTEHAQERAIHVETQNGAVVPFPVIASDQRLPQQQERPPQMGENSLEILEQLGFDETDIEAFRKNSVVQFGANSHSS